MIRLTQSIIVGCLAPLVFGISTASAASPVNDDRVNAVRLNVPQLVTGTTVDATVENGEPGSSCFVSQSESVWYGISGVNRRVALTLVADGDLDAVIDVFERKRSQTTNVGCSMTDKNGIGIVAFKASSSSDYLVRVAPRQGSVVGTFSLTAETAADEAEPPGRAMPRHGVTDTVNLARNPSDAWSVRLRSGVSYRFNLTSSGEDYCVNADLYARGDFEDDSLVHLKCSDGYALFTPQAGDGGTYTLLVRAAKKVLGNQNYHLEVSQALRDDTSPGVFWAGTSVGGHLRGGGIDVVDLYNFDVRRLSSVELRVRGDFSIQLRRLSGGTLARGDAEEPIERRLPAGQYYAVVIAESGNAGDYTLRRVERAITSTSVSFDREKNTSVSAGRPVRLSARVSPASAGRIEITLERLDPIFGWQFERLIQGNTGGVLSTVFTPPGVGRWRAKAEFKGSRSAVSSRSGYAKLNVGR